MKKILLANLTLRIFVYGMQGLTQLIVLGSLSLESYGIFTLVNICINYAILFVGFNLYTYTNRLIAIDSSLKKVAINFHIRTVCISYSILLPAIIYSCIRIETDVRSNFIIFLLLTVVVLNNQLENVLIGCSKPIHSAFILLIRYSYGLIYLAGFLSKKEIPNYDVYVGWFYFELFASFYGAHILIRVIRNTPKEIKGFSYATYIRNGLLSGVKNSCSAICLLIVITNQRLILNKYEALNIVGIFQTYFYLSSFSSNIVETSFFNVFLPKLTAKLNDSIPVRPNLSTFKSICFLLCIIVFMNCIVYLCLPFIFKVLHKESLVKDMWLFIPLVTYTLINFLCRYFHYYLYAHNLEGRLLVNYLVGCIFSIAISFSLIEKYSLMGASLSCIFTSVFLLTINLLPFYVQPCNKLKT